MPSLNQTLLDRILSRASTIERLTAGEQKAVLQELRRLERALLAEVEDAGLTRTSRQRLRRLLDKTRITIADTYRTLAARQQESLRSFAALEFRWTMNALNSALAVEAVTFSAAPLINDVVKNILVEDTVLSTWWRKQARDLQKRYTIALREGLLAGETMPQLLARIRGTAEKRYTDGVMALSRAQARTLTRTAVQAVSMEARQRTYQEASDVVKGTMQLSTLDLATSDICKAYSRKAWDLQGRPIGHALPFNGGPPRHFNCRSTLTPILFTYSELFARNPDFLGDLTPANRARLSRIADGQPPDALTYQEWLRRQSKARQQDILGPSKFALWEQGLLRDLSDLVDQSGRPLRIAELYAKLGVPRMGE